MNIQENKVSPENYFTVKQYILRFKDVQYTPFFTVNCNELDIHEHFQTLLDNEQKYEKFLNAEYEFVETSKTGTLNFRLKK